MTRDPVLYGKDRRVGVGVLEEQRIVADTKAEEHIEFGSDTIQDLCLDDRIARRLVGSDEDLLPVFDAESFFFGDPADLAEHACDVEPLGGEDLVCDPGLMGKPHTEDETDLLGTQLVPELTDFLDSRLAAVNDKGLSVPIEVAFPFLNRGKTGEFTDLGSLILSSRLFDQLLEGEGRAGVRSLSRFGSRSA